MEGAKFSRANLDRDRVFQAFEYEPSPLQREIHASDAKYRFVACGVRFGKTFLAAHEGLAEMFVPGSRGWVVGPTYNLAEKAFRVIYWKLVGAAPKGFIRAKSERDLYVKTNVNSELYAKSADRKDGLIDESLDWAIIDEAARVDEEAYEMVRARLVDRDGWLLCISTPTGRNWFERGFRRGQDPEEVNYASWNAPTWANPFIKPHVLQEIKRTVPERTWRQEYAAEFVDDDGAVFKNVDACATARGDAIPEKGRRYLVSWDVGKYQDYSVTCVWDVLARSVVHLDRFQGDWPIQIKRVMEMARKWNRAEVWMDATGQGDAVFTMLDERNREQRFARRVVPIRMHNPKVKRDLVENLALGLERLEISYPNHPTLLRELRIYEYERKASGAVTYHAPNGHHDDCVISLAIGYHAITESQATSFFKLG